MNLFKPILFLLLFSFCSHAKVWAQKDTTISKVKPVKKVKIRTPVFTRIDTSKAYNPRIATIRSAILPGWGQITNHKLWKLPIVYGALGTTAVVFFYNVHQFKTANAAYKNAIDVDASNDGEIPAPYYAIRNSPDRIKTFRNEVRQNVDYSVLFFIVFWGLNVVDAAVDAHLKKFDVSPDLSFKIKAGYSPLAGTNGLSLVLNLDPKHSR
jgi:hypothetical protein